MILDKVAHSPGFKCRPLLLKVGQPMLDGQNIQIVAEESPASRKLELSLGASGRVPPLVGRIQLAETKIINKLTLINNSPKIIEIQ